MKLDEKAIARFWRKVRRASPNACWMWTATMTKDGYGQFRLAGQSVPAHRVAYAIGNGRDIAGYVIRHKCDNRRCCNPAHLDAGTHADNVADRQARNRQAAGQRNGRSKLTPELVAAVRASELTDLEVAVRLRIDKTTVRKIRAGRIWAGDSMGSVWEGTAEVPFLRRRK